MNFYNFPMPAEINGDQLKAELGCDEVYVRDNKLVIGGNLTEAQAKAGIAAHKPVAPINTAADKAALLAKLGITADELQTLLG